MADRLEAFRLYDFEGNEKWRSYQANLELPAGRDATALIQKFKAKWYQREIDESFDPALVQAEATAQASDTAFKPTPQAPTGSDRETSSSRSQQTPKSTSKKSALPALKVAPQAVLFVLHSAIIVLAILHLQPLNRKWSFYAWLCFLQATIVCSAYKVYLKYGLPRLRPFPAALKQWAVPATSGTDFHYAMLALLFLGSKPIALVLVPITVLATYHWFAYVRQQDRIRSLSLWQRFGEPAHGWLVARQGQALQYNAVAEIGIGFVSVLSLLSPPRNFLVPFLVFNFLRMRYWSPDAATFHRQAWYLVDQRTHPILQYLPLVQVPLNLVKKWFLRQ